MFKKGYIAQFGTYYSIYYSILVGTLNAKSRLMLDGLDSNAIRELGDGEPGQFEVLESEFHPGVRDDMADFDDDSGSQGMSSVKLKKKAGKGAKAKSRSPTKNRSPSKSPRKLKIENVKPPPSPKGKISSNF